MKKRLLFLVAILVLSFSSMAFAASNSSILGHEEQAVKTFMQALTSDGELSIAAPVMTEGLKKNLDAGKFESLKVQINTALGQVDDFKLALLQKGNNVDRVVFLGKFAKHENVEMVFIFNTEGKKPLINDISFTPIEQQAAPATEAPAETEE